MAKFIETVLPQKASFKSSYRKCSLCVGGLLSHTTACDMTLRFTNSNRRTEAMLHLSGAQSCSWSRNSSYQF